MKGHGHWVNTMSITTDFVLRSGPYDHTEKVPSSPQEGTHYFVFEIGFDFSKRKKLMNGQKRDMMKLFRRWLEERKKGLSLGLLLIALFSSFSSSFTIDSQI